MPLGVRLRTAPFARRCRGGPTEDGALSLTCCCKGVASYQRSPRVISRMNRASSPLIRVLSHPRGVGDFTLDSRVFTPAQRSRSGRVMVRPLAFWANEIIPRASDGGYDIKQKRAIRGQLPASTVAKLGDG